MAVDVVVYDKVDKESEKIQDALYALYPQQTITDAATASFADGSDSIPVKELVVGVEPAQDLHGQANPYPPGGGKNKFNALRTDTTINGVTITKVSDGIYRFNGTATAQFDFYFVSGGSLSQWQNLPAGNYIANGLPSASSSYALYFCSYTGGDTVYTNVAVNGTNVSLSSDGLTAFFVRIYSGAVLSNIDFSPMIRLATETDATFAPYSNICPITGWTGAEIEQRGKNLLRKGFSTITNGGITFTANADGTVTANGTSTNANAQASSPNALAGLLSGDYYITFQLGENAHERTRGYVWDSTLNTRCATPSGALMDFVTKNNAVLIRIDSSHRYSVVCQVAQADLTVSDIVYKPMVTAADVTEFAFEPCTPRNYPVTFPSSAGTVYGGTLDVTNGVLTATHAILELDGVTSGKKFTYSSAVTTSNIYGAPPPTDGDKGGYIGEYIPLSKGNKMRLICNIGKYVGASLLTYASIVGYTIFANNAPSTTVSLRISFPLDMGFDTIEKANAYAAELYNAGTPIQMLYKLAEPIEYQLTSEQISGILTTLYGTNNIWADCGDIEKLTYRADLGKYIDSHITTAVANALNA